MSTVKTNNILDASGGNTATINSMTPTADSLQGFRNRIINGDMRIDQRNAGASVTVAATTTTFGVDRFFVYSTQASKVSVQQNAGSVTPPAGFSNYVGFTSLSAYSVISSDIIIAGQNIEGFNSADLNWGTVNAKTITLSFWVRSSLTGNFGAALLNSAQDRSYPFSYTISSANTWEQKSITIAGDTTGTWVGATNGSGIRLNFAIGVGSSNLGTANTWAGTGYYGATGSTSVVGTNGATWYITGVQLEVGSVATPFERRPYGTELQLCQRYYYKATVANTDGIWGIGFCDSTTVLYAVTNFPVTMRTTPSALEQTGTASDYRLRTSGATSTNCSSVPTFTGATTSLAWGSFTVASGLTAGQAGVARANSSAAYLAWSAEL